MFSGLIQGNTLHVLKIKDGIEYYNCPIEYISAIHPAYPTYTAGVSNGMNMGSVVDITVSINDKKKEFAGVSALSSVSTSDSYIITDNKEAMISQVDNILQSRKKILNEISTYEDDIKKCQDLLKKLNPVYAKESAMDDAISELTDRVNSMQSEFGSIKGDVGQILNLLKNK